MYQRPNAMQQPAITATGTQQQQLREEQELAFSVSDLEQCPFEQITGP